MTAWVWMGRGGCLGFLLGGWLAGCAALADPAEEAFPTRPPGQAAQAAQEDQRMQSVVLPVFNATGRGLRLAPDLQLGLFEPIVSPKDSGQLSIPELIQAGFMLGLQKEGRNPAAMDWTSRRVPDSPPSIEAAWQLASDQHLKGDVIWITVTDWDDLAWRQRSIIRISAEVVVFESGRTESLRTQLFDRHPFVIPPLSTLAQAAGHIGMRMASMTFR
jgi:hypothetical protein